ncbi:MAG TPA: benzoate-CoA ligase family protein [Kofleriaceae bacterium]|nr:benzoate-CoA ligase family protein [Kofleriaceae bacterium]
MHIEHDNLASKLLDDAVARGWGDRIALREGARTLTYQQLRDQAARAATALRALRIDRGDRVAVLMPDSLEAAVALLGAIYHGAIAVPLSELGRANDIADLLNDSGAAAVVVHGSLRAAIEEIGSGVPGLREVLVVGGRGPGQRDFVSLVRGAAPAAEPAIVDPEGTAILLYSAGAHGELDEGGAASRRRGVPHAHATPLRAFESLRRGPLPLGEDDRVLSVVRLWTAYGIGVGLLFPLAAGAETLLLPEQPHSRAIFAAVESWKPTALFATPSVYGQLARDAEARGLSRPLGSLRVCVSGAEDMPTRVTDRVRDTLGAEVTVSYGLTEAFQFVLCGPAADGRSGACGKPVPGFDVRVVNDAGEEIGADEIGTLEIRGPTVAVGYWNDNRSTLRQGGWFKTRDRFLVDRDGNYFHCGRADDLFKVGGKWVTPAEVEQALMAHEAVWECAVVGADDEDGLIKPLAFVVPNIGHQPGPELEVELREYVKQELAPYKYPRWIEFLGELPKGPHGKVLRYKLRDRVRASVRARRAETANT